MMGTQIAKLTLELEFGLIINCGLLAKGLSHRSLGQAQRRPRLRAQGDSILAEGQTHR
jgi:hypothetical protein